MIRIAVCDDDTDELEKSVSMVKMWSEKSGIEIELYCFDNGDDLITKNLVHRMDVILLDIIMPLLNGMDTARELRQTDKAVNIVFLTSSPEYALDSYSVKAKGYLLKPVAYEKLKELLDELSYSFEVEPKHLVLKTEFGYQKVYYKDIEYIEAQNKIISLYMNNGRVVETTEPLRSFESKLNDSEGFFKCHRSYIVYIPNVDNFNNQDIFMKSGRCVPIARGCGKAFQEAYFAYVFKH